ncbi:hypothetical protein NLU13_7863 [Sarocladium strictum]|uniref:Zn(2)-C6 fungal-type domain-containing protein n=1 Tax=Sarocladium strictum TaxID=5046 RepID=A0AA39GDL8_SARSR|nr:hypothetical protein NLU13_7863 [Sarocladium strictum]
MSTHGSGDAGPDAASEADMPSCQECRRRKLKCSREQPVCAHCARLESPCVYDLRKNRPGVKPGAVGNLSRRIDALESTFEQFVQEQSRNVNNNNHSTTDATTVSLSATSDLVTILSALVSEVKAIKSAPQRVISQSIAAEGNRDQAVVSPSTPQTATSLATSRVNPTRHDAPCLHSAGGQPRKRRRVDSCGNFNIDLAVHLGEDADDALTSLPPAELLEEVIDTYFTVVQPWIPMLHETQFRRQIADRAQRLPLAIVLHAMVVAALRFVGHSRNGLSDRDLHAHVARSRRFVVMAAMDQLSVESLQALTIIAYDDIGNGEASRAWSIIGSMTRTVDYLQLSLEPEHRDRQPLLRPLPMLDEPQNWTEEEQRRRVFWNVFCLDRFCSVTTGWNTSLTSSDVQRRLPADGGLWHKEEGVTTPYLGVWDRSTARIGTSIAFLPGTYLGVGQEKDSSPQSVAAQPGNSSEQQQQRQSDLDMTTVGAFAYRIEATESLSRITTYFLQQKVDFTDRRQVSDWLTRFKELDLRLVHWKMFLPQRWRDSNISRQPSLVRMDPNLTLAHVTHNTSMILLHQRIAYPEPSWSDSFQLPSFCSAETCQMSAMETTTITQRYHKHTAKDSPVATQYAFCVFISARVLLIHHRYYRTPLAPEFWILVGALDEMAKRWAGPVTHGRADQSLAGKYAAHLRSLHTRCTESPEYKIDVLGYSNEMAKESKSSTETSSPFFPSHHQGTVTHGDLPGRQQQQVNVRQQQHHSNGENDEAPGSTLSSTAMNASDGFMEAVQSAHDRGSQPTHATNHAMPPDTLASVSHMLMDDDFMALDRIISLDDMIFANSESDGNPMTWASNGSRQFLQGNNTHH